MTRDDTTEERLDELESHVQRQQQTLTEQRATIAAQRDRIERLEAERSASERDGPAEDDSRGDTDASPSGVSRRGILQGLGVAGLVGLGAGTASADEPRGVVGSGDHPVDTLYLDTLSGNVTGGSDLTSFAGDGLAIEDGALGTDSNGPTVADFNQVVAEDVDRFSFEDNLDVRENDDGIEVTASDSNSQTDISDDGTTVVGSTSDVDFGDNLAVTDDGDGSATVDADVQGATNWTESDSDGLLETVSPFSGIDVSDVRTDSLNGGVTGGTDVTGLVGNGLSVTGGSLGLTKDSVTVAGGDGLTGGGSVDLGGSTTLDIDPAQFAGNALEVDGNSNLAVSGGGIGRAELAFDALENPGQSSTLSPGFGNWVGADPSRPSWVEIELHVETDGSVAGRVDINYDDPNTRPIGDGSFSCFTSSKLGAHVQNHRHTLYLPPGGRFRLENLDDPTGRNEIRLVRAVVG